MQFSSQTPVWPPLLRTKLNRPRRSNDTVERPRLLEWLDRRRPLVLVVAPAGYGKTTLLSNWLEQCELPNSWFSLDEGDNHLANFLTYLLAAVHRLFPAACQQTLAMVTGITLPPLPVIAQSLINELDLLEQPFVLVLDDYHLIVEPAIHELLAELLRHPPRSLVLALSARHDPPLPLATLRAHNKMVEVRAHDLRFTLEEATVFLQTVLGIAVGEQTVSTLLAKAEGWAAGLYLAALFLRQQDEPTATAAQIQDNSLYTLDFLAAEVLAQQPPALQAFLIRTSILDRLCMPLCEAVVRQTAVGDRGEAYLRQLAESNLFIVALDEEGHWYRYHHLLQQLLRHELSKAIPSEEIAVLHLQASAWFAANDLVEDAISHALAAGSEETAVRLVEANRHQAMNQERWQQLEGWLRLLPRQLIDLRPELLLLETWTFHHQAKVASIPVRLTRVEALLEHRLLAEDVLAHLRGEIDVLHSQHLYWTADSASTFAHAQRALRKVPLECSYVRAIAWLFYIASLHVAGESQATADALNEAFREDRYHNNTYAAHIHVTAAFCQWEAADLSGLMLTAEQMLRMAGTRSLLESATWAHYFRGCARYQRNDLAGAESDFSAVVAQRYVAHSLAWLQSTFGLASTYQAQGKTGRAREILESAKDFAQEMDEALLLAQVQAFQARLALLQDRKAEAYRWAARADHNFPRSPMPTFHVVAIGLTAILIDQGTATSLQEASSLVTQLLDDVRATNNTRFRIELLALHALLYDRREEKAAALAVLEQAINLARPGGLLRVFVDLGPRVDLLLAQLAQRAGSYGFIDQIRSIYSRHPVGQVAVPEQAAVDHSTPGPEAAPHEYPDLNELLTFREMDVLLLLMRRYTNKEIARELGISTETVRQHTVNLFRKLQVENRRQAIVRAHSFGIVAPS